MIFTKYSFVMGILWFFCAAILGSCLLLREKGRTCSIIAFIFVFGVVRMILPADIFQCRVIQDWHVYPQIQKLWRLTPFPGVAVWETIIWVWAAGTAVFLCWQVFQFWRLFRARRQAISVPESSLIMEVCQKAACIMGYRGDIHLVVSAQCQEPALFGFWTPWIFLSEEAAALPTDELQGVLCHEISHFQHRDLWYKTGLLTLRCLLWWNPAAHLLARSGEQLLELQCDCRVCQRLTTVEQMCYLNAIIKMLKLGSRKLSKIPMGCGGQASRKFLAQRFHLALYPCRKQPRRRTIIAAVLIFALFLASYTFTIQPASRPTQDDLEYSNIISGPAVTSFIFHETDGTYSLIIDGIMRDILTAAEVEAEPYCTYQIIETGG